jgi:hypothetical protein
MEAIDGDEIIAPDEGPETRNEQQNTTRPAPMPHSILIGDRVKLNTKRQGPYTRHYGIHLADKRWQVMNIDTAFGNRKRLYVDGEPSMIWASDALLDYGAQSSERRRIHTKLGTRLP